MQSTTQPIEIKGKIGFCGDQRVFLGFAPASTLVATSFADVLNEELGTGYQRPINHSHSAEFRRYIQTQGSTTIPLTLNLRDSDCNSWSLEETETEAILRIVPGNKVFAQVDCQHRLGHLLDLEVPLAFMSFIRLTVEQERGIFTTINSKAKGLSGSLIDANLAKLANDLCSEVPDLYIAIRLADDPDSPWYNKLRKGGVLMPAEN